MVDHDHHRVKTGAKREIGDEINGDLIERTGAGGGDRR